MKDALVGSPHDLEGLRRLYEGEGVVIVPGGLGADRVANVRQTLMELIGRRARSVGLAIPENADLDAALRVLRGTLAGIEGELMVAVRESPAFRELVHSRDLMMLVDAVSPSSARHFAMDFCMMRVDTATSEERRFDWHFDTAYTALPHSAVTCWIPLTRVTGEMGCLRVIPGSHRQPQKVRFRADLGTTRFSGPKRIELAHADVDDLERRAVELPPLSPGDVVLLHGWLLHRSGQNTSSKARWICNPRYCDLWDPEFISAGWKASRSGTPWIFRDQHPELVVDDPSDAPAAELEHPAA